MKTDSEVDASEEPAAGARKKRTWIVVGGLLAVIAVGGGARYWIWAHAHEETDDAYVTGHLHEVSSRVEGTVQSVEVDDNDAVATGQVLVRLDPHDFEVKVAQAEANLAAAEHQAATALTAVSFSSQNAEAGSTEAEGGVAQATAGIATAEAAVAEAESGVSTAQARKAEADATLERTKRDDERYAQLVRKEQVSKQQYDNAHAAYKVAVAAEAAEVTAVQEAEARLVHARHTVQQAEAELVRANGTMASAKAAFTGVEMNRRQLKTAQSNVAVAQAELEEARLQLSYTVIAAPKSGAVGRKTVEAGQRVQPGQPLLAVVEPNTWVVANFKETQLTQMRPGQDADVEIDTFSDRTFHGKVQSFSPASGASFALLPPDNATGNFTKIVQRVPVKILLSEANARELQQRLSPGLSAVVTVKVR